MDIKLKKYKGIISFICLSLATIITLIFLAFVPYLANYYQDVRLALKSVNTSFLKSEIASKFVCEIINDSFMFEDGKFVYSSYFDELKQDKNMYFEVRFKNKVMVKSEHADFVNAGLNTDFAAEYGAVFNFKDGKLSAKVGDKELNVYGNNIFVNKTIDLYVPGYENFQATDEQKQIEVLVGLKKEPVMYSSIDQNFNSQVYRLKEMYKLMRAIGIGFIVVTIAVIAMFVMGIIWRKHKKLVDQFFAKLIKFIPLEFKGICVCALAFVFINKMNIIMFFNLNNSLNQCGLLILTAVVIWLLAIDFKYNKPIYKQSVLYLIYQLIALPNVKKGVFRKQIRLTIVSVACFIGGLFAFLLSILAFITYSPLTAIICFVATCVFFAGSFFSAKDVILICKNTGVLISYLEQLSLGKSPQVPQLDNCIEIQAAIDRLTGLEKTLQLSLKEQMKAEHMKIELIANVSHDIKTPLTSVISYIDLLKEENDLPQHIKEYVTVLDEKSQRLKNMVQDIFEVSKAASGELSVEPVELDLCRLIRQTVADSADVIAESGMIICENISSEPCEVIADSNRMYRVYQNLLSNALKYSILGTRIHINVQKANGKAVVSIKNISAQPLDDTVDFTQRFVRGDASRSDGGSGLGLSIASSFTNACGGKFYVETNADLFSAYTEFDLIDA